MTAYDDLGLWDFTSTLAALEKARVVDFIRFVARQDDLAAMEFRTGWNIALGRYSQVAANAVNDA